MKVDLIPHSTATNSYGLLMDVISAIDDEPNRFDWSDWFRDVDEHGAFGGVGIEAPTCGTQACLSGWIGLLTAERPHEEATYNTNEWFPKSTHKDLDQLFYANAPFGDDDRNGISPCLYETQRQYADRGIRAVRLFMQIHEAVLKAHTINIPLRSV